MTYLINFFKRFESEILLTEISLLVSILNWGKACDNILWDFGREVYIPHRMNEGLVLYKDIINIFGPLSYQINSVIIKAFGDNLNTFYVIGITLGIITSLLVFWITKIFTTNKTAFVITLAVTLVFILAPNYYALPYSYGIIYAGIGLLASVLFYLKHLQTQKGTFLALSFLFAGFSLANKYEYIVTFSVLVILTIRTHKLQSFKYLVWATIFPVSAFALVFLQGLTLPRFLDQLMFIQKYARSQSLQYLYTGLSSFIPRVSAITILICSLLINGTIILATVVGFKAINVISNKEANIFGIKGKIEAVVVLLLALTLFLSSSIVLFLDLTKSPYTFVPSTLAVVLYWYHFKYKNRNQLIGILLLLSIASAFKGFFVANMAYEAFLYLLPLVSFFIVFSRLLSFKGYSKTYTYLVLFSITLPIAFNIFVGKQVIEANRLNSTKGQIYINNYNKAQYSGILEKVKDINSKVLIIPEGLLLNYLAEKDSEDVLEFMFMPPYMDAYKETNLINDLKEKDIKHIVIMDKFAFMYFKDSAESNSSFFGTHYGNNVYNYILANYNLDQNTLPLTFKYFVKKP